MKLKNSTHVQDTQLKQLCLLSVITLNIAALPVCMKLKIWSLKIPLASRTEGLSTRIWRGCGFCPPFPSRHSSPHVTTSTCGWGVVSFPGRGLAHRCWCCLSVTYTGGRVRVPRCVFNGWAFLSHVAVRLSIHRCTNRRICLVCVCTRQQTHSTHRSQIISIHIQGVDSH
jgi:hypothetical protein